MGDAPSSYTEEEERETESKDTLHCPLGYAFPQGAVYYKPPKGGD